MCCFFSLSNTKKRTYCRFCAFESVQNNLVEVLFFICKWHRVYIESPTMIAKRPIWHTKHDAREKNVTVKCFTLWALCKAQQWGWHIALDPIHYGHPWWRPSIFNALWVKVTTKDAMFWCSDLTHPKLNTFDERNKPKIATVLDPWRKFLSAWWTYRNIV